MIFRETSVCAYVPFLCRGLYQHLSCDGSSFAKHIPLVDDRTTAAGVEVCVILFHIGQREVDLYPFPVGA
jgi:hypothetical protein